MNETAILQAIRLELGKRSDVMLFRNNCGAWKDRDGRIIRYGLGGPGGADLIGWVVRNGVATFCALEIKAPGGVRSDAQTNFIEVVRKAGGVAGFATSVEEAEKIIYG